MKRARNLYDLIAEPENLRLAFLKSVRGKRHKPDVIAYTAGLDENLRLLRDQLLSRQVDIGHYHFFTVHDPKERVICAASFPERVLHHAIMNICEPVLESYAIHDSYACRKGKGMHMGVRCAQDFTRSHPWYLKLDIRKYFDSIDHGVMLDLLARRFKDADLLALFARILDTYRVEMPPEGGTTNGGCTFVVTALAGTGGKGLPIGNLISQHLANFYLGHLDHRVKEVLRVTAYVRYMDDFVLWGDDKAALQSCLADISRFLADDLGLALKDNIQINRSDRGLPFLGYRVFPHRLALGPRARRRFCHRLRGYEQEWQSGNWAETDLARHMEALLSYVRFADTLALRKRMVARISVAT